MTPAIAAAAPLDGAGLLPPASGPAEADGDAFRSALAALFAMVAAAAPTPEIRSIAEQTAAGSTGAAGLAQAGDPLTVGDADADSAPAGDTDPTQDDERELVAVVEQPPIPMSAAVVTQILGRAQPSAVRVKASERYEQSAISIRQIAPEIARQILMQGAFEQPRADMAGTPARPSDVGPSAAPGEIAFEAVITEDSANDARPMVAQEKPQAPAAKAGSAQPDTQSHERVRDGSQRIALDADSTQQRKRQPDMPQPGRSVVSSGFGRKSEMAAAPAFKAPAPQGAAALRTAEIERVSDTRVELVAVRHLRLQVVPDPTRPVEVLVAERAGAVHVSVRASDAETSGVLRGDLQGLVADLERSGFRAETFAPTQAASHDSTRAVDAALFARSEPDFADGQRRWQQQDSRPRHRKRDTDDEDVAFNLDYTVEKTT